jgi:hypothetical protein
MKISYAITVCNESKDLYSLISFLKKVKDPCDEVNILVDSLHVTASVHRVLEHFRDDIIVNERDFCGDFTKHRNFHLEKCSGDYIFVVDPDEMPQEKLIKGLKKFIVESEADLISIPRINIHPGAQEHWLRQCQFRTNEFGWINWPDYQCRIFENAPGRIYYSRELHENVVGAEKSVVLQADPSVALWHIKSVDKQDSRWEDGRYVSPSNTNLYDTLM